MCAPSSSLSHHKAVNKQTKTCCSRGRTVRFAYVETSFCADRKSTSNQTPQSVVAPPVGCPRFIRQNIFSSNLGTRHPVSKPFYKIFIVRDTETTPLEVKTFRRQKSSWFEGHNGGHCTWYLQSLPLLSSFWFHNAIYFATTTSCDFKAN